MFPLGSETTSAYVMTGNKLLYRMPGNPIKLSNQILQNKKDKKKAFFIHKTILINLISPYFN